jgi:FMN reductase
MSEVLVISGSPSPASRTELLGEYVAQRLAENEWQVNHLRLRVLPPASMLGAELSDPAIAAACERVARADGIVLATPTYKASYSGLLKVFLDLLPQYGLAEKAVLPLATGGSAAHVLMLDYALRPVIQSMAARHVVQGFFLLNAHVFGNGDAPRLDPDATDRLDAAIERFRKALIAG